MLLAEVALDKLPKKSSVQVGVTGYFSAGGE